MSFFLRLALIYALLALSWIPLAQPYRTGFCFMGDLAFGSFGSDAAVRFESLRADAAPMDVEMKLQNRHTQAVGRLPVSSRYTGYLPAVTLTALILATSIPWQRRWRALLWGIVLVHAYIAARVMLMLLVAFSGDSPLATMSLGTFGHATVSFLSEMFSTSLAGCYIGPIIIWIAVTLRQGDLYVLRAKYQQSH